MLKLSKLFLLIKQEVDWITNGNLDNCNFYVGVGIHTCDEDNDKMVLMVRYRDMQVNGFLDDDEDLTTNQDEMVYDVMKEFKKRYDNHEFEKVKSSQ